MEKHYIGLCNMPENYSSNRYSESGGICSRRTYVVLLTLIPHFQCKYGLVLKIMVSLQD